MTYRSKARKRWPKAYWILGEGRYALLAHCKVLTITLHDDIEKANASKEMIDKYACGGRCVRKHEIVDLS